MEKNIEKNKSKITILGVFLIVFVLIGGTLAYLNWQSSEAQKTNVVFTVKDGYECAADGGGDITNNDAVIAPASCTNSTYAIQREVTVMPTITGNNLTIEMDLWLNIDELGEGLSQSENFRYALTTSDISCDGSDGKVVASGNFKDLESGDKVELLNKKRYKETQADKYYLYIWLDAAEKSSSTQNQIFDLSLGGSCVKSTSVNLIESYSCANESVGEDYLFTYTGNCEAIDDGSGNWRVRFLTNGTFKSSADLKIDAFLVGGGGGGGSGSVGGNDIYGGGGGGGGYTLTRTVAIEKDNEYEIIIGTGGASNTVGGNTTAFDLVANGGGAGSGRNGGTGGSGGGGGCPNSCVGSDGGSDGNYGVFNSGNGYVISGGGQGNSTYEFGDSSLTLYAGGGGSGFGLSGGAVGKGGAGGGANGANEDGVTNALDNTGGGGGGGYRTGSGGEGGSGIVVIRNTRSTCSSEYIPNNAFDFTYTGDCEVINDGNDNWRIKFLTDGIFTSDTDLKIDAFLVGGGGGGSTGGVAGDNITGGGGGGGGYTLTRTVTIEKNMSYEIVIGDGGTQNINGGDTTGFDLVALGGNAASFGNGGTGGSGGGASCFNGCSAAYGGSNGGYGIYKSSKGYYSGGGQGNSTYEFGDSSLTLYAGGGGGGVGFGDGIVGLGGSGGGGLGGYYSGGGSSKDNTGGGGGGGYSTGVGGRGGSGIIVIRNTRSTCSSEYIPNDAFDFTYTGECEVINDGGGNWRIKFLTDGTFIADTDLSIDAFLVGGGGGGAAGYLGYGDSYYGGSGGGSGHVTNVSTTITKNIEYTIVIGAGGASATAGNVTSGFGQTANGGNQGVNNTGGNGGSGGGTGSSGNTAGNGGSNGANGTRVTDGSYVGVGDGVSTYEFGNTSLTLYAGGGGGGIGYTSGTPGSGGAGGGAQGGANSVGGSAADNTGGGGGGGSGLGFPSGGSGGSGIIVIRNKR